MAEANSSSPRVVGKGRQLWTRRTSGGSSASASASSTAPNQQEQREHPDQYPPAATRSTTSEQPPPPSKKSTSDRIAATSAQRFVVPGFSKRKGDNNRAKPRRREGSTPRRRSSLVSDAFDLPSSAFFTDFGGATNDEANRTGIGLVDDDDDENDDENDDDGTAYSWEFTISSSHHGSSAGGGGGGGGGGDDAAATDDSTTTTGGNDDGGAVTTTTTTTTTTDDASAVDDTTTTTTSTDDKSTAASTSGKATFYSTVLPYVLGASAIAGIAGAFLMRKRASATKGLVEEDSNSKALYGGDEGGAGSKFSAAAGKFGLMVGGAAATAAAFVGLRGRGAAVDNESGDPVAGSVSRHYGMMSDGNTHAEDPATRPEFIEVAPRSSYSSPTVISTSARGIEVEGPSRPSSHYTI